MLLSDKDIRELAVGPKQMIQPFSEGVQGGGIISYGLTTAGYDLRLGDTLLVFKNSWNKLIDPKRFKDEAYCLKVFDKVMVGESPPFIFEIPAHSYVLGFSLEYLRIPDHLKGRCVGKSTYARCGIVANTTPVEPGWCGHLTIEIANTSPCPVTLYAREGIVQLEIEVLSSLPEMNYATKGGKYQGQSAEPVPARVIEGRGREE